MAVLSSHHDYGRGGRGWRDLWQGLSFSSADDPQNVGAMIEKNYGGVRIDGTNATIIGDGDGNFIADRNGIARVWMDHAPLAANHEPVFILIRPEI